MRTTLLINLQLAFLALLSGLALLACGSHGGAASNTGAGGGPTSCESSGDCVGYEVCVHNLCVSSESTTASVGAGGKASATSSATVSSSSGAGAGGVGSTAASSTASSATSATSSTVASTSATSSSGCVPQCSGLQCGPDGCGGECGTCPYVCTAGQCTGVCTPGATQCDQSSVQLCQSSGQWETTQTCGANQTCSGGQCVAACTGETFQFVNDVANYPGVCSGGATYSIYSLMFLTAASSPGQTFEVPYQQYTMETLPLGTGDSGQYACCLIDEVGCAGYTTTCKTNQGTYDCTCLPQKPWSVTANSCGTSVQPLCN